MATTSVISSLDGAVVLRIDALLTVTDLDVRVMPPVTRKIAGRRSRREPD